MVLWLLSICLLRTYRAQRIADKFNKVRLLSKLAESWSLPFFISFNQSFLYPVDTKKCAQRKLPCWILNYTGQQRKKSFSSVQFSCSVMSDSLLPNELQHTRPPCPSPAPRVHPNPCALSRWCHPTISSSVVPFSSCPQPFPASGSFPVSQLFTLGGQSIEVSASTSVLPMNTHGWSPLGWTGWISLQSKGLSRVFSITTVKKHQFFSAQISL